MSFDLKGFACYFFLVQASIDSHEVPVFKVEDLWQTVQGPTSLVELTIEQKEANIELVEHHYALCVILHAVFVFSLKSVKPLSMFDTKVCYVAILH